MNICAKTCKCALLGHYYIAGKSIFLTEATASVGSKAATSLSARQFLAILFHLCGIIVLPPS